MRHLREGPATLRFDFRDRRGRTGFGDAVNELVQALDVRAVRVRPGKVDRR
jgi:hypothetical protein